MPRHGRRAVVATAAEDGREAEDEEADPELEAGADDAASASLRSTAAAAGSSSCREKRSVPCENAPAHTNHNHAGTDRID